MQDIVRGLKSEQIFPKYSKNLLSDFPACINLLLFRRTCYYLPRIFSNLLGSSPFEHLIPIIFPFFFLFSSFFFFSPNKKNYPYPIGQRPKFTCLRVRRCTQKLMAARILRSRRTRSGSLFRVQGMLEKTEKSRGRCRAEKRRREIVFASRREPREDHV